MTKHGIDYESEGKDGLQCKTQRGAVRRAGRDDAQSSAIGAEPRIVRLAKSKSLQKLSHQE